MVDLSQKELARIFYDEFHGSKTKGSTAEMHRLRVAQIHICFEPCPQDGLESETDAHSPNAHGFLQISQICDVIPVGDDLSQVPSAFWARTAWTQGRQVMDEDGAKDEAAVLLQFIYKGAVVFTTASPICKSAFAKRPSFSGVP